MAMVFTLLERDGTEVGKLLQRKVGSSVSGGVDLGRTYKVNLSFYDKLRDDCVPLASVIRAERDGVPLCTGPITIPNERWRDETLELNGMGPQYYLQHAQVNTRSDIIPPNQYKGNTTNNNTDVTGMTSTAGLAAGMDVEGPGIRQDTQILSVLSGTAIRMTKTASATQTGVWLTLSRGTFLAQVQQPQADIMWKLLQHVMPTAAEQASGILGHGISRGVYPAVGQPGYVLRDRAYESGDEAYNTFTTDIPLIADGLEWDLRALDGAAGALAAFDSYSRQGTDKSDTIVLHFGWGKETAADFTYDPDATAMANRSSVFGTAIEGEPSYVGVADQPDSQQAYKAIISDFQSKPDTIDIEQLQEVAQGTVAARAWPPDYFTVTPAMEDGSGWVRGQGGAYSRVENRKFGVPPGFGPDKDYWQGDTIRVIAKHKSGKVRNVVGRVVEWSFTEVDRNGNVAVELKCQPLITLAGVE